MPVSRFNLSMWFSALLVLMLLPLPAALAADEAAEALEGAWLVSVGSEARDRFLIVSGARSQQGRVMVDKALYGWIDAKAYPVKNWHAEIFGDSIKLSFFTPSDSAITTTFGMDETTVEGTFVLKGRTSKVRLTRLPPEELAELRAAAKLAGPPPPGPARPRATANSKIHFVYVGAPDCPSCVGYELDYFGERKALMGKVIPDFPKINYVKLRLRTYKNRGLGPNVPEDLKWLEGKLPNGSLVLKRRGVPFFALVVDDKVWVQGHGTTALETLIAPQIKRAVAEKYAGG